MMWHKNLGVLVIAICSLMGSGHASATGVDATQFCRERIAKIICLVDPVKAVLTRTNVLTRPCLHDGQRYVAEILEIFDLYPQPIQRTMCGLKRIFIEKSFWASGYVHPHVNAIGIQQEFLENDTTISEWATWKERLPFAMSRLQQRIIQGLPVSLPRIVAGAPGAAKQASYYIIAHELAHRIDIANSISDIEKGNFARFSWQVRNRHVHSTALPSGWEKPCFYLCNGHKLELSKIAGIYEELIKSPYVSLYATQNPAEDFAETLVFYLMSTLPNFQFELKVGASTVLDIKSIRRSRQLREKLSYVEMLLNRPSLAHGFVPANPMVGSSSF